MRKEDLKKLSDNSLIELCKLLDIQINRNISRGECIFLILEAEKIKNEKHNTIEKIYRSQNNKQNLCKPDGIGIAGGIINIIGGSIAFLIALFFLILNLATSFFDLSIMLWSVTFLLLFILSLFTLVSSANFIKGKEESKLISGILGLIFGFFIGGILIFISEPITKKGKTSEF